VKGVQFGVWLELHEEIDIASSWVEVVSSRGPKELKPPDPVGTTQCLDL
jgi:hypothetical protein